MGIGKRGKKRKPGCSVSKTSSPETRMLWAFYSATLSRAWLSNQQATSNSCFTTPVISPELACAVWLRAQQTLHWGPGILGSRWAASAGSADAQISLWNRNLEPGPLGTLLGRDQQTVLAGYLFPISKISRNNLPSAKTLQNTDVGSDLVTDQLVHLQASVSPFTDCW